MWVMLRCSGVVWGGVWRYGEGTAQVIACAGSGVSAAPRARGHARPLQVIDTARRLGGERVGGRGWRAEGGDAMGGGDGMLRRLKA